MWRHELKHISLKLDQCKKCKFYEPTDNLLSVQCT